MSAISLPFYQAKLKINVTDIKDISKELTVDIEDIFTEQINKTLKVNDFM